MRKAQLKMLDILIEVDKICKKHNITYCIDYGTLLGAVRHGGFIPWDDDLDISMMKEDYDRFLTIAPKELPEQYVVQNICTEKYCPITFTKIVDKKSKTIDHESTYSHERKKYNGVWLDIFPILKGDIRFRLWIDPLYGRCFRRVHHLEPFNIKVAIAHLIYPAVWLLKQLMCLLCSFCNDDMRINSFGMTIPNSQIQKYKSDYLPPVDMRFENITVPAPKHYDKVLKEYFGDYMQLPPVEKRAIHTVEFHFFD